jgi:hypothetical protein
VTRRGESGCCNCDGPCLGCFEDPPVCNCPAGCFVHPLIVRFADDEPHHSVDPIAVAAQVQP